MVRWSQSLIALVVLATSSRMSITALRTRPVEEGKASVASPKRARHMHLGVLLGGGSEGGGRQQRQSEGFLQRRIGERSAPGEKLLSATAAEAEEASTLQPRNNDSLVDALHVGLGVGSRSTGISTSQFTILAAKPAARRQGSMLQKGAAAHVAQANDTSDFTAVSARVKVDHPAGYFEESLARAVLLIAIAVAAAVAHSLFSSWQPRAAECMQKPADDEMDEGFDGAVWDNVEDRVADVGCSDIKNAGSLVDRDVRGEDAFESLPKERSSLSLADAAAWEAMQVSVAMASGESQASSQEMSLAHGRKSVTVGEGEPAISGDAHDTPVPVVSQEEKHSQPEASTTTSPDIHTVGLIRGASTASRSTMGSALRGPSHPQDLAKHVSFAAGPEESEGTYDRSAPVQIRNLDAFLAEALDESLDRASRHASVVVGQNSTATGLRNLDSWIVEAGTEPAAASSSDEEEKPKIQHAASSYRKLITAAAVRPNR